MNNSLSEKKNSHIHVDGGFDEALDVYRTFAENSDSFFLEIASTKETAKFAPNGFHPYMPYKHVI